MPTESHRENHWTSDQSGMQGSHHGGRHDTGVSDRVDAVLGAGPVDRVRRRPDQPGRQHHTGAMRQVEYMLESHHLHRA